MRNTDKRLSLISIVIALLAAGCQQTPPAPATPVAQPAAPAATQIGGKDVLTLKRAATGNGSKPEFLSVTLFPGRAMNMFQVTANLPGKGEVALMHSPSVAEA